MFEEVKQTPTVSAVEPSLYQQILDIFKEGGGKHVTKFRTCIKCLS